MQSELGFREGTQALAKLALLGGTRAGEATVERLSEHKGVPEISASGAIQVTVQCSFLGYSLLDRVVFSSLGDPWRIRIMDAVEEAFVTELASWGGGPSTATVAFARSIQDQLDAAQLRWETFPVVPKDTSRPVGSLYWGFAKEIATLVGRTQDMEAITTAMVCVGTAFKSIPFRDTLSRITLHR